MRSVCRHLHFIPSRLPQPVRHASTRTTASFSNPATKPVPRRPAPPPPAPALKPPRPAPAPAGGQERQQRLNNKTLWRSWKDLPYNTKLMFSAGIATVAVAGSIAADKLEDLFPARNNRAHDRPSRLSARSAGSDEPKMMDHPVESPPAAAEHRPRLFSVSVVEREPSA